MSMDRSLRSANSLIRHRNVLTRAERLVQLKDEEKWDDSKSVYGLPKVGHRKQALAKKEAAVVEGAEGAAAPAAGAKGAAPAGKGAAPAAKGAPVAKGTAVAKGAAPAAKAAAPAAKKK